MDLQRDGFVVPVPVDPTGRYGPTPKQARGPGWRCTSPGRFVPATVGEDHPEQRIIEVAAGLPSGAAITGWAALCWMRVRWFDGRAPDGRMPLPVPVALGDRRTIAPRPGVVRSEDWLFDDDIIDCDGLRITCPARSITFETRRARSLVRAVQAIDLALAGDAIHPEELGDYIERLVGRRGVGRTRAAAGLADANVWSPQETAMRIEWRRRFPSRMLLTNRPIFDRTGRHLITPDLLDEHAGVAGEYDGAIHLEDVPRRRDLDRDALYRDLGLELVTMMSTDRSDTAHFLTRLDGAYRRAAQRRGRPRVWTIEQPSWWVDTSTVARRRALSAEQREIWLRRQVA